MLAKSIGTAILTVSNHGVVASHGNLPCEVPSNLSPLFSLLDSITQIAFLGGVGLATLGFTSAGLLLILPGQDNTRLGKSVAKNVLIGSILLLSANMIVSFLVNELGTTICS
ncbi:hypothetical protein [Haloarcula argentinensis]|uniref:hypothetical protein n=1 Tax=Haloarcula argentinensis TaxID=43776 RepID=UPI00197F27EB|nr:hypothetical protein [Haloarcula argentinensis]